MSWWFDLCWSCDCASGAAPSVVVGAAALVVDVAAPAAAPVADAAVPVAAVAPVAETGRSNGRKNFLQPVTLDSWLLFCSYGVACRRTLQITMSRSN